jgi:hypothetical protein
MQGAEIKVFSSRNQGGNYVDMVEQPEAVIRGIEIVGKLLGVEKAVVGKDHTIFYRPSLNAVTAPGFMADPDQEGHPVHAIVAFRDALRRQPRGVEGVRDRVQVPGQVLAPDARQEAENLAVEGIPRILPEAGRRADWIIKIENDEIDEIPAAYRGLVLAPIVKAYKYSRAPHTVLIDAKSYDTQQLLGQIWLICSGLRRGGSQ